MCNLPLFSLRRFDTHRLLPAKYSRNYDSVLTRLTENDQDLQRIFELDNATNERILAEENLRPGISPRELVFQVPNYRIINAAFTHPNPLGARFSTPERGAWYGSFELATAKAEVLFHKNVEFAEIAWTKREELHYDDYLADFTAAFHDLRPEARAKAGLKSSTQTEGAAGDARENWNGQALDQVLSPTSYVRSQQLAVELFNHGSLGVIYPSVRRAGGTCLACFRPSVVSNVRKSVRYKLIWSPAKARFLRQDWGISGTEDDDERKSAS